QENRKNHVERIEKRGARKLGENSDRKGKEQTNPAEKTKSKSEIERSQKIIEDEKKRRAKKERRSLRDNAK
ncbi:hypothetical protein ALC62_10491, partial [Cyphomyrmex costatus]